MISRAASSTSLLVVNLPKLKRIEELASALLRPIARRTWDVGRLGYARSAGGSGGRGKLRLNRAKDILSSKTPEPQVGVARVSPLFCGPVQGNWNATVMKQADEEVPLLGNSTVLFGTFGCLENVYSGRHAHAQGQGQGAGAQSILLPSTIDNRFNARSLAGNPDSPQAVVFLTSIVDVTVGS